MPSRFFQSFLEPFPNVRLLFSLVKNLTVINRLALLFLMLLCLVVFFWSELLSLGNFFPGFSCQARLAVDSLTRLAVDDLLRLAVNDEVRRISKAWQVAILNALLFFALVPARLYLFLKPLLAEATILISAAAKVSVKFVLLRHYFDYVKFILLISLKLAPF